MFFLLFPVFFLLISKPCSGEIIKLKNGNVIETKILKEDERFVVTEAKGGKVKIPRSDIETIWRGSKAELLEVSSKRVFFTKGVELYQQGEFMEAADSFQRALGPIVLNPLTYANLGSAYASAGSLQHAEANYLAALQQNPNKKEVLLNLAHVYEAQNQIKKAIERYQQVLEITPEDQEVRQNLAYCYYVNGDFEKSLKSYESLKRRNDVPIINNRAAVLMKLGRYDESLDLLKPLTDGSMNFVIPFLNVAEVYRLQGEYEKSEKQYQTVLSKKPKNADALMGLARLYAETKEFAKAEQVFRDVLSLQPDNVKARTGLAGIYTQQNDFSKAEEQYEAVIEAEPDNLQALNNLGLLFLKQNEPQKALRTFHETFRFDQRYAKGHANAGLAYAFLGDVDNALKEWKKALELDPGLKEAAQNKKILEEVMRGSPGEEKK